MWLLLLPHTLALKKQGKILRACNLQGPVIVVWLLSRNWLFCDPVDCSPSSTLAWKILWMEEPGGLQSMGSLRVGYNWATSLSCIGEGNGNPLQCSCLENPRDGGAWWAAVYEVAQSRTRLKWLSSSSSSREYATKLSESSFHLFSSLAEEQLQLSSFRKYP